MRWIRNGMLSLCFCLCASLAQAEAVRLAIGEWAPYTSEKNPRGKLAEILVTKAFAMDGVDTVYSYFPWKRAYELVRTGEADGTFPWYENSERRADFHFAQEPLMYEKEVIFHLKSTDFQWRQMADLKNYIMGGTIGYSHIADMEEAGVPVQSVSHEELNFKKMLAGRIQAYPAGFLVGYDIINRIFPPEKSALFTNHPKAFREAAMYGLFSRKAPNGDRYAEILSRNLAKMKASGRYDEIIVEHLTRSP